MSCGFKVKNNSEQPLHKCSATNLNRKLSRSLSEPSTPRVAISIDFRISFTLVLTLFLRKAWRMFSQSPAANAERTKSPGTTERNASCILSDCLLVMRYLCTLHICSRRTWMLCTVAAHSLQKAQPRKSMRLTKKRPQRRRPTPLGTRKSPRKNKSVKQHTHQSGSKVLTKCEEWPTGTTVCLPGNHLLIDEQK